MIGPIRALLRGLLAFFRALPIVGNAIRWMDREWVYWKDQTFFLANYFSGSVGVSLYASALVGAFPEQLPWIQITSGLGVLLLANFAARQISDGVRRFLTITYLFFVIVAATNFVLSGLPLGGPVAGVISTTALVVILLNGLRRSVGGLQDRAMLPFFGAWGPLKDNVSVALGLGDQLSNLSGTTLAKAVVAAGQTSWLFIASGIASLLAALFAALGANPAAFREVPTEASERELAEMTPEQREELERAIEAATAQENARIAAGEQNYGAGTLAILLVNFVLFFLTLQLGRDFDPARLRDYLGAPQDFVLTTVQAAQVGEVLAGLLVLLGNRLGLIGNYPPIRLLLAAAWLVGILSTAIPWLPLSAQFSAFVLLGAGSFSFNQLSYSIRGGLLTTGRLLNYFKVITLLALVGQPTLGTLFQIYGLRVVPYAWGVFGVLLTISTSLSFLALSLPTQTLRNWDDAVRAYLREPERRTMVGLRALGVLALSTLSSSVVGLPLTVAAALGAILTYVAIPVLQTINAKVVLWLWRNRPPANRPTVRYRTPYEEESLLAKIFRRRDR